MAPDRQPCPSTASWADRIPMQFHFRGRIRLLPKLAFYAHHRTIGLTAHAGYRGAKGPSGAKGEWVKFDETPRPAIP